MKDTGTIIRDGGRIVLKIGAQRFPMGEGIKIPEDLIDYPAEDYELAWDGRNKYVSWILVVDDDGEEHELTAKKPSSSAANQRNQNQGRPNPERDRRQREEEARLDQELEKINQKRFKSPARAPYNFVPLNDRIVSAPPPITYDAFHEGLLSGYITVRIESKTPFFIRKEKDIQEFFKMNGEPFVPGSSLRGMARALVEICGWGALQEGFYNNRKFSFRSMADMCKRIREEYKKGLESDREIKGGYLYFNFADSTYYIIPATGVETFDIQDDGDTVAKYPESIGGGKFKVFTGMIQGKKKQWIMWPPRNHKRLPLPADLVSAYHDDRTRKAKVEIHGDHPPKKQDLDLLKVVKSNPDKWKPGYPVFYMEQGDAIISFGHTPNYRLPYNLRVKDHIEQTWTNPQAKYDFATSIFGTTAHAGRVWFEDHQILAAKGAYPPKRTKLLMEPKPTTFQHYLAQHQGVMTNLQDLLHWGDQDAPVRGFKQYWHRGTSNIEGQPNAWPLTNQGTWGGSEERKATDQAPIRALRPGTVFQGRIRFENLRKEELGALLFVLDLPEGCCHKLGLGKPLGLGSIQIRPELTLIDRAKRYSMLWDEAGKSWHSAAQLQSDLQAYKDAFANYVGMALGLGNLGWEGLWKVDRLKELQTLLEYGPQQHDHAEWLEQTRYMEIEYGKDAAANKKGVNEYRDRPVLPKPTEVKAQFTKRSID